MHFNDKVLTTAYTDSGIFLGGEFTQFRGTISNRIIYLTKYGTIDDSFQIGSGFNNNVKKIYIQQNKKILIGGSFTSYNGQNRNRIIRLNEDGSIDGSFNIGSGFNGDVEFITQQSDGKILIGGSFTSYNGQNRNKIIRLNEDGSIDQLFNIGSGFNDDVYNIHPISNDNRIIVGGKFTTYNNINKNRLVILNSDGNIDNTFDIGPGFDNEVRAIYYRSQNQIFIGGSFLNYKNNPANRIISLQSNGNLSNNFQSGSGFDDTVYDIIPSIGQNPVTEILIGGKFTYYKETYFNGLVKISLNGNISVEPECTQSASDLCYKDQGIVEITPGDQDITDILISNELFFSELSSEDFSFDQQSIYPDNRIISSRKLFWKHYSLDKEYAKVLFGTIVIVGIPNSNKVNIYEIEPIDLSRLDFFTGVWIVKTKYSFKKLQTINGPASTPTEISRFGISIAFDICGNSSCAIAGAYYDINTNEPKSIYVKTFKIQRYDDYGSFVETQNQLNYDLPPGLEYAGVSVAINSYALIVGLPNLNKVYVYYLPYGVTSSPLISSPEYPYFVRPDSYGNWEIYNTYISPFLYENINLREDLEIYTKDMAYGWDVDMLTKSFARLITKEGAVDPLMEPCNKSELPPPPGEWEGRIITNQTFPISDEKINFIISDPFNNGKKGMVQSFCSPFYRMPEKDGAWRAVLARDEIIYLLHESLPTLGSTSKPYNSKSYQSRAYGFCLNGVPDPGFYIVRTCQNNINTSLLGYYVPDSLNSDPNNQYGRWNHILRISEPFSRIRRRVIRTIPDDPFFGGSSVWLIQEGASICNELDECAENFSTSYYSYENVPYPWQVTNWRNYSDQNINNCIDLLSNYGGVDDVVTNACFKGILPDPMPIPYNSIRALKDLNRGSLILDSRANLLAMARNTVTYYANPKQNYFANWKSKFFDDREEFIEPSISDPVLVGGGIVDISFFDSPPAMSRFKVVNFTNQYYDDITIFDRRVWRDISLVKPDLSNTNNLSLWLAWGNVYNGPTNHDPNFIKRGGSFYWDRLVRHQLLLDYYPVGLSSTVLPPGPFNPDLEIIGIDDRDAAMAATKDWSSNNGYKTILENNGNILVYNGNNLTTINIIKNWTAIAMSEDGKYQTALAWNESSGIGEIYRSNDYGATWSQGYQGAKQWKKLDISDTGQFQTAVAEMSKIFVSHDYGVTWIESFTELSWNSVSLNGRGDIQLACTLTSVYESKDYGISWSVVDFNTAVVNAELITTALNKNKEKYNYIIGLITNSNNGWFSINSGKNFNQISLSPKSPNPFLLGNCKIGSSYDAIFQTIVVNNGKVFTSRNYGITWNEVVHPVVNTNKQWKDVAISENGKYQTAVAFNDNIYVSDNFGKNWTLRGIVNSWESIKISSNGQIQIAVASNNRIYRSNDYGVNWSTINHPVLLTNKNWRSVSISKDGKYQTAVAFNGNIHTSDDYGVNWVLRQFSRPYQKVDMSLDGQFQTVVGNNIQIFVSRNYGQSWVGKSITNNWIDIAINDNGEIQIATSVDNVYISYDYGETWNLIDSINSSNFSSIFISKNKFNGLIIGPSNTDTNYDINHGWRSNMQYGYKVQLVQRFDGYPSYRSIGCIGTDDQSEFNTAGIVVFEKYSKENNNWKRFSPDLYGDNQDDKIGQSFDLPAVSFNNSIDPKIKFISGYGYTVYDASLLGVNEPPTFTIANQKSDLIKFNFGRNILTVLNSGDLKFYANECINLSDFVFGCCETDAGSAGQCWCCSTLNECYLRFESIYQVTSERRCSEIGRNSTVHKFTPFALNEFVCVSCQDLQFNPVCPNGSWDIKPGYECFIPGINPPVDGGGIVTPPGFENNLLNQPLYHTPMEKISLNNNILSGIDALIKY
jgi:photosystem II stability/assembly factor-like uncharacterized protein